MSKAGDNIRAIADRLKAEQEVQVKALSRICSAAAKLADNNDKLVTGISELLQEDLDNK